MENSTEIVVSSVFESNATYLCDGVVYDKTFPEDWAKSHLPETGPLECENCMNYGMVENIFLGYCANCAQYCYLGARGTGYIDAGVLDYEKEEDFHCIDIPDEDLYSQYYREDCDENALSAEGGVWLCNPHYEGGYNDF
jgi:hypothetical protein